MKKLFPVLIGLISITSLKAQSNNSESFVTSKSVYVELLGAGLLVSVNYDSRFGSSERLGYRVGLGVVPSAKTVLTIPVGLNALFGKGPGYFEAELTGTVYTSTSGKFNGKAASTVFIYPHIGYRHTKLSKSFLWRIYAGPIFSGSKVTPYGGLSLGYTL